MDASSLILLNCPLLESITLRSCSFVGDEGIEALAENCPNLASVNLYLCSQISEKAIKEFEQEFPKVKIERKLV